MALTQVYPGCGQRSSVVHNGHMPPRPNLELTTTQKEVFDFYCEHSEQHGAPPPVLLIVGKLGIQRSTVYQALDALQRKGFLKQRPITIKRLMPVKRRTP